MTSYDSTKWELVNGATIDSVGIAEPSAPYSARLNGSPDGNDLIQSKVIDLSSHSSATLAYAFERTGGGNSPEINDDLIVEYKNSSGVWIELDRQLGSGVDMSTYSEVQKPLPVAALHSAFQFRFRTSSTPVGAFDDWFVDDVLLTGDSALAAPVMTAEPATTAGTSNTVAWSVVVGATQYYAEYDTDSTFSSPDGNSGWISSSSHTFTGLNTDITYYYRVKARSATGATGWTNTGSMLGSESWDPNYVDGGLITLDDGRVLAIQQDYDSFEVFNPTTGAWSSVDSPGIRYGGSAVKLANGQVLLAGGNTGGSSSTATAQLFDPTTNTWSTTGSMNFVRSQGQMVLLDNGKVLYIGGWASSGYLTSCELYDPATGTWANTGSLSVIRDDAPAVKLQNGKVLVAGGYSGTPGTFHYSAELYDPATGSWSSTGSMSAPLNKHFLVLLDDGKVLAGGSIYQSNQLYDPASGAWSPTGAFQTWRDQTQAIKLQNGKVLVVGGEDYPTYFSSCELYDPSEGTWSSTTSMGITRSDVGLTMLNDGRILVAGGYNGGGSYLSTAEIYSTGGAGSESGWSNTVLSLQVADTPSVEDFETGNFSKFQWTHPDAIDWTVTTTTPHAGTYAAKSGTIADLGTTTLQVTQTTAAGNITFWRNVSSESGYDFLRFYIDGVEQGSGWSGELDWAQQSYAVSAGMHTFKWAYSKDHSVSSGSDAAWIDDIQFPISTNQSATPTVVDLLPATDTGYSPSDNITNLDNSSTSKKLQFNVAGTVSGATVTVYSGSTVIGTAMATGTTTTVITNGSSDLADGVRSITAKQTESGKSESAASTALAVTIDTVAPASPAPPDLQSASDTGASSSDNVTNDKTPTFTVSASPYFRFYRGTTQISGDYQTGNSYTTAAQADGTFGFSVRAVDAAGNESGAGAALSVIIDTIAPTVDIADIAPDPRTTAVSEVIVSFNEPVIGFDRTDLALERSGAGIPLSASNDPTTSNDEDWTIPGLVTLTDDGGSYVLTLTASGSAITDVAGNPLGTDASDSWFLLRAPVMDAEPATTAGTSNTVSWSVVAGADEYYVEFDTTNNFTSPDGNSGWVTGTSHEFTGLTVGQTYYYRVKTRVNGGTTPSSLSQTKLAEYDAGILTNTSATAPGDITLTGSTGGEIAGRIANYSFETADANGNPIGWQTYNDDPEGYVKRGDYWSSVGANSLDAASWTSPEAAGDWRGAYQVVDFTGIAAIRFDAHSLLDTWVNVKARVWIDDTVMWEGQGDGVTRLNQEFDVSAYTGNHILKFGLYYSDGVVVNEAVWFDNVRTYATGAYCTSDSIVSPTVTPTVLDSWGPLNFAKSTPTNSTLTVEVLNSSNAVLASNGSSGTKLDTLGITASSIKQRANLATTNISVTTSLSDGTVGWIETNGSTFESDWSNIVSSQQVLADSTAPSSVDLLAVSDTGIDSQDNKTRLDNSAAGMELQFSVADTVAGATVTIYADGFAIGSAVASGTTTVVTTNGNHDLLDGTREITARQAEPGKNESSDSAALNITIDTVPVTVAHVIVGAASWNPVFIDGIDGGGVGGGNGLGFQVVPGQHISTVGIDRLYVQFTEDIGAFGADDMELLGSSLTYIIDSVSYNRFSYRAEVHLQTPVGFDKLRLAISDSLADAAGNLLDGDSGGGEGGIFDLRFDVAPGDINGDGQVFTTDLLGWRAAFNSLPGSLNYNPAADLNGDGQIFTTDLFIWQSYFNNNLSNLATPPESRFRTSSSSSVPFDSVIDAVDQIMSNENPLDFL